MTEPSASAAAKDLTFAKDIKPLFRPHDRDSMLRAFDLWSAADVEVHGQAIAARLQDGTMPCDGPWLPAQVTLFTDWLANGARP